MIRILIVEDSLVVSLLLKAIIEAETDMSVIGQAVNGEDAVQKAISLKPDLITMDIRMPAMDGFEATRQIMAVHPTPIVVISSNVDDDELRITFRAIEEGALAVIEKPQGIHHPDFDTIRGNLVDTIRAMSEVKLVRRHLHRTPLIQTNTHQWTVPKEGVSMRLVALGCSTGGPQALHTILSSLPEAYPFPILVTQHISQGFVGGLVSWLDRASLIRVKLAEHREKLQRGTVYLAPDNYHLTVRSHCHKDLSVQLDDSEPVNGFRPSATPMFRSLAETACKMAVGGILTGMGNDGAMGLLAMRRAGCQTFVQNKESSIIFGMPAQALALSAADTQLPLEQIATHLLTLTLNQPESHTE